VEIDHAAIRHNLKAVQKLAGKAGIMAVVKANGYGHGLNEIARSLSAGVEVFAVASLGEALQLRLTEKKKPILLLSAALPSEYVQIGRHGFIPTISALHEARLYSKSAPKGSPIHFKIDTGMGRLGCSPIEAASILAQMKRLPVTLHSISTHLPSADSDYSFTVAQLERFEHLIKSLRKTAPGIPIHVLNSAATMLFPRSTQDIVRVGLALYGISPLQRFQKNLQPALTWKAAVTFIHAIPKGQGISYGGTYKAPRNLRVAVLPVGYADGYPRQLSGKGAVVLIRGKKCPVLGRVTMDQIMVDVSSVKGIKVGDEAVLVGKQEKTEITATEVAAKADTIPWHLFCGITARVAYTYKG
jgi:alanine racemase